MVSLISVSDGFTSWKARRDNPHKVTAGQLNAYSKSEIDNILSKFVPSSILPISHFGDRMTGTVPVTVTTTTTSITFKLDSSASKVLMKGTPLTFSTLTWTFNVASGLTRHIYCSRLGTNSVQLELVIKPRVDTPTNFYVGTIKNTNGRITYTLESVILLGRHRLSATPRGSAIPVSTGLPTEKGTYEW